MKGNSDNGDGSGNDVNNNQSADPDSSTSSPRKKQCLAIPSKPHDEGSHGSALDLDNKVSTGSASLATFYDSDELLKEIEATKGHLDNLRKQYEELEVKAKSGTRILVKEVKSLRRLQHELKEKLQESLLSKSEVEVGGTIGATSKDVTTQKQGMEETQKQPLDMVEDQMTEETDSDPDLDPDPDSDSVSDCDPECFSDNETVLDHTHEDLWFTRCAHHRDNRRVHIICLENRIRSRSECKEYLKKVGCDNESHFLGGSKGSPHWFYARLTKDEADKLALRDMEGSNGRECNKSVETIRDVKGNDEDGNCGDNDHNNNQSVETNLSTSPPRKKQCLVISSSSSKPDNEGLHGSEPDLVSGTIGATSKDVTTQKQGIGETQKQPLDMVQDQMTEETYFYSDSGSGSGSGSGSYCESDSDSDSDSDNDSVLSHTNEDRWFGSCDCHCDNRKIYLVVLEKRINSKSECKEYLKKIGCDSKRQLLGGSKASPYWFYARLSKKEVAKLAREGGVRSVSSNFFFP